MRVYIWWLPIQCTWFRVVALRVVIGHSGLKGGCSSGVASPVTTKRGLLRLRYHLQTDPSGIGLQR